ncbi:unnamed protein product [Owenia fusiformis]|uniref:Uncharacterized protein n=1 Tax=Owenia fusiformis TaxID=6347 RepID=A0A8J1XJD8_OWEFU|nr:unnamed protein product [Owenia fusiformis]
MNLCIFIYLFAILSSISAKLTLKDLPFRNTTLKWEVRVDDLVKRLKVEEIISMISHGGSLMPNPATPAIPRLGIKPYMFDDECLRGDAQAGKATAFPEAINLGATFNADIFAQVGMATSYELRAKNNNYTKYGYYGWHSGLSCFSPMINIMRHPLWGRNQESYGEDPFLTGIGASNFVKGLQGDDKKDRFIRASAGCKHFAAYAGPENTKNDSARRLKFNAKVSERDLQMTHYPAFKECLLAGTYSVMCSYNSVNGVPSCANKHLLTDVLRKDWKFKGYVVSDEGAIEFLISQHKYVNNSVDAASAAVNAGCNLELPASKNIYLNLNDALKQKKTTETTLRELAKPLIYTRMRLGEFDSPYDNPWRSIPLSVIQSPEHRMLSLQAAMQSFVLLKNQNDFLPMDNRIIRLAVVGPMANNSKELFGDYSPDIDPKYTTTPWKGLNFMTEWGILATGCSSTLCPSYNASEVENVVKSVDLSIVCLGTGVTFAKEGHDRQNLSLPGQQEQLMKTVIKHSKGPIILLVFSAGPVDIKFADDSDRVVAIVQCFYPAQEAGEAIRRTLWMAGPGTSFGGRLPYTWYTSADQTPHINNYTMHERTYRYFTGTPLYPFGYGLSYGRFEYTSIRLSNPTMQKGKSIKLNVGVKNVGRYQADEVIQVYISYPNATVPVPQRQLSGIKRVTLSPGEEINQEFSITSKLLEVWHDTKGFIVEEGKVFIWVSGQQPYQKRQTGANILFAEFKVKK